MFKVCGYSQNTPFHTHIQIHIYMPHFEPAGVTVGGNRQETVDGEIVPQRG